MKVHQIMKDEKIVRVISPSLTPQNAKERGFEYIDDVIYEEYIQSPTMRTIFELTDQYGFKLGVPKSNYDSWYGLYAPIS